MKLLIVEDEKGLQESISSHLTREGYVCETASTYDDALEKIHLYTYDCVMVDLNLPDGDGFDIVREIKKISLTTGIIIISARNALDDKITGLEIGSDDYLTKPFHLTELNARVKSLLRRRQFAGSNEIIFNEIKIDLNTRKVYVHEEAVTLFKKEFDLLLYFAANKDTVLTKIAIAEHLWGDYMDTSDSFDIIYSHIKTLRKKLVEKGSKDYIHSVYGIGYKFGAL